MTGVDEYYADFVGGRPDHVILPIEGWWTPVTDLPEQQRGNFRLKKGRYKAGTLYKMNDVLGYDFFYCVEDVPVTKLQERRGDKWHDWMVDDPVHWYGMGELALLSRGPRVLAGGLGLGLIVHHLVNRRDIEKIVVVEMSQEVLELVQPSLPNDDRYSSVVGDFFDEVPRMAGAGEDFDTVVTDFWVGASNDPKTVELYERTKAVQETAYPHARHLYHVYGKALDTLRAGAAFALAQAALEKTSSRAKRQPSQRARRGRS